VLERTRIYRVYHRVMDPLLRRQIYMWAMLGTVTVLLIGATAMFFTRGVAAKMLPFDDKDEMQIIVDMPERTPLETTVALAEDMIRGLADVSEISDVQLYAGTAAPFNFNGMIRHYYLRRGTNVADIQVNLVHKSERGDQSHDIAKRIRPIVEDIAVHSGTSARVKVVEVPPGPPVLSTLVAEIYGPDRDSQIEVATRVREIFADHPSVVDVDWSLSEPQREVRLQVDEEKAALSGVPKASVIGALQSALGGKVVTHLSQPTARTPVPVRLRLTEAARSGLDRLGSLHVASLNGQLVPLSELVRPEIGEAPQLIDRKNGQPVVYVTADVAGEAESPVYAILDMREQIGAITLPSGARLGQLYARQPGAVEQPVMKWDGEWQVTYEVFRDLGIAFGGALLLIYVLIVAWFGSFVAPLVMMTAIPLTLVGIAPGHWMFGAFFTATSMIGMIALAGIMVRNGILLIDYLEARRSAGIALEKAVIEAGAVRTRPIALTAGTVVIGAIVILFDPIFEGLAVSLITGALASTVLTLIVVPSVYYLVHRARSRRAESKTPAAPEPDANPVAETE
nr:AcrB/AcrD/AcrF family protein [Gemmatimonadota bacterium]NIO32464.1 AcrB/AcrD/AcrF family protein [Gemmatimonadota bacterium]